MSAEGEGRVAGGPRSQARQGKLVPLLARRAQRSARVRMPGWCARQGCDTGSASPGGGAPTAALCGAGRHPLAALPARRGRPGQAPPDRDGSGATPAKRWSRAGQPHFGALLPPGPSAVARAYLGTGHSEAGWRPRSFLPRFPCGGRGPAQAGGAAPVPRLLLRTLSSQSPRAKGGASMCWGPRGLVVGAVRGMEGFGRRRSGLSITAGVGRLGR